MRRPTLKLVLLSLLSLIVCPNAIATSKVQFEGGAENFVFYSDKGQADLFDNLNSLLPGEKRTENITVKNIANDYDFVKIYLRAEPTTGEMHDFLAQLTLNVYLNDELVSSSSAAEPGTLETNLELGIFNPNDEVLLMAEILAPSNLGNNYMNLEGGIDWVFTAEAYKDGKIANPDTGTMTNLESSSASQNILLIGLVVSLVILAATVLITRRREL